MGTTWRRTRHNGCRLRILLTESPLSRRVQTPSCLPLRADVDVSFCSRVIMTKRYSQGVIPVARFNTWIDLP